MQDRVRVLVADDNATDRLLLSSIVRKEGYEVITAEDGRQALDAYFAEQPQLVLLDALMPELDGFEVAREIKSAHSDNFVPVVFLTSLKEAGELAKCVEAGGDDFLSKPFNKVILAAKLKALERMRQMHHTLQSQRDQITRHHARLLQEQEAAKAVFDNVSHQGDADNPYVRQLLSPLSVFNGDVSLAAIDPAGDLTVLLGDFTGHGLTAAIGAMPLADIFYGMVGKGFALDEILKEANRKLKSVLPPGFFCCTLILKVSFRKGCVEFWNGGLPDAVMVRTNGSTTTLPSRHLALGILDANQFDARTDVIETHFGDRLYLCTDGVVEARNSNGEQFGYDRLQAFLKENNHADAFEALTQEIYAHLGEGASDDDLTLVEVSVLDPDQVQAQVSESDSDSVGPEDWKLSYELGPRSLRVFNPLPLLQRILMEAPSLRSRSGQIYTVLSELFSNALEHGVMGLESDLKNSADGFALYYAQRAAALETLSGFVRFEFDCAMANGQGALTIDVSDSGSGFDYEALQRHIDSLHKTDQSASSNPRYHGRGVVLLQQLCERVEYFHPGNRVRVRFIWEDQE